MLATACLCKDVANHNPLSEWEVDEGMDCCNNIY